MVAPILNDVHLHSNRTIYKAISLADYAASKCQFSCIGDSVAYLSFR